MSEDVKLYNGDCFDVLRENPFRFDCLITDPPYYTPAKIVGQGLGGKEIRRSLGDIGVLKAFFIAFAERVEARINPAGSVYIFCDSRTYPFIVPAFYEMTSDIKAIIWDKEHVLMGHTWRRQYEMILWGMMPKAKPVYTSDGDVINMRAVPPSKRRHPTQKPVPLLEKLILKSTKEGDVVFDAFMGSGTTGEAAVKNGRRFIGCEISKEFFDVATDKIAQAKKERQLPL